MSAKASPPGSQFWKRIKEMLGSDLERQKFFDSLDELSKGERARRSFRLNPLRGIDHLTELDLLNVKNISQIPWCPRGYFGDFLDTKGLSTNPLVGTGAIYLQEAGAMEVVQSLDVRPGHFVLDLCAAPGGKATQIGEDLGGSGWLIANEPVRSRAQRLNLLLARHGILNSSIYALDPSTLAERYPQFFDRIMVDAPCSGESLFAKRVEKRKEVGDQEVIGAARRQRMILMRASEMLAPDGLLAYSTCTYSVEENEEVVKDFLDKNPEWQLVKEQRRWPHIDKVAGGYFAILKAPSSNAPQSQKSLDAKKEGLIRHGPVEWNNELDEYALSMKAKELVWPKTSDAFYDELEVGLKKLEAYTTPTHIELNEAEARRYLKGEALNTSTVHTKGIYTLSWKQLALGPAKFVDGRFNNLLPKLLRAL